MCKLRIIYLKWFDTRCRYPQLLKCKDNILISLKLLNYNSFIIKIAFYNEESEVLSFFILYIWSHQHMITTKKLVSSLIRFTEFKKTLLRYLPSVEVRLIYHQTSTNNSQSSDCPRTTRLASFAAQLPTGARTRHDRPRKRRVQHAPWMRSRRRILEPLDGYWHKMHIALEVGKCTPSKCWCKGA